ncbi:hypothetical protein [Micromonospora yangpuensis]|uniref:AAA ATPase domain-containing protein n=1 Tax=Micromonospora yangpuensis TaxID=683228 RepID=A0A1C6U802_9ACTN|nr:hypothetical protein [Micromonospora yangpuensis]GGL90090.1 hypothetical protein GCM10012279_04730 [Micromonospora yangpuensis]SCL49969.1 AAA ATPase domain-containing protein [Micromonospora yangpuensis]
MVSPAWRTRRALLIGGCAVTLGVAAAFWGLRGVEVLGWLAGIGSFVAAVAFVANGTGGEGGRPGHSFRAGIGARIRRILLADSGAGHTFTAGLGATIEDVRVAGPAPAPAPHEVRPPQVAIQRVRVVDGLVGRDEQLAKVMAGIRGGHGTFAVLGGQGMGKTSFLSLLRVAVRRDLPDVVLMPTRADMTAEPYGLSELYRGQYGSATTTGISALVLEKSAQLLGDLVQDLVPQFGGFVLATEGIRGTANSVIVQNTFAARSWGSVSDARIDVNVRDESPVERLRRAQRRIDEAFLADWRTFLAGRRAVLILDGFETLIDDAVGQWFVAFAARLPDTVVVLSLVPREYAEHGRRVLDPDLVENLPRFTVAETQAHLAYHFGDRAGRRLAELVVGFTGGHPYGLKLVVQFIHAHVDEALDPDRLRELLSHLSDDGDPRVDELVRAVIRPERSPDVWRVAQVASLLNSFDVPMLLDLLDGEELAGDAERVGRAVGRIERLGLLDPLPVAGRFRLHDFVRPAIASAVRRFQPARWTHLHRRAAAYYYRQVAAVEEKTTTVYGSWFKYENAVWQMYEAEWLSHSAQLPDERQVTRIQFVVLFLKAFWWWGLYITFSFCHQLLDSWQRAARTGLDRDLLDEVRRFHQHYPTGPDKPTGAHWTQARHALRAIGELCGVHHGWRDPGSSAEVQELRRQAWLYLRLFTAHTYWYDRRFAAAEATYGQLEPEFLDLADEWMLAWLYYEWAQVGWDAGDRRAAATRCRRSSHWLRQLVADEEIESELLANVHRLLGDLLHESDPVAAAEQYGQAVKHAFVFHRMDNVLDGSVSPPDDYTSQFYTEITLRAAARAVGWDQLPRRAEILAALVEATAGTPPEVLDVGPGPDTPTDRVAAQLFPRGPEPAELYRRSGPFTDHWGEVVDRLDLDARAELDRIDQLADELSGDGPTG